MCLIQQKTEKRVGRILQMHANQRESREAIFAGDIAAAIGLDRTVTGDTLCDFDHPVLLEAIEFPAPVMSISVKPQSREDQDKLSRGLIRLAEEDPTFTVKTDEETKEIILSGMGELHLEIIVDRLKHEFKVEAGVGRPQVAYRETILKAGTEEYKHVKQSGGRGQYGHVVLELIPRRPGKDLSLKIVLPEERFPGHIFLLLKKESLKLCRGEFMPDILLWMLKSTLLTDLFTMWIHRKSHLNLPR